MTELFSKVFEKPARPRLWLDALAEIASGDSERIAGGLLALAMHDPDPSFARGICRPFLEHVDPNVRATARICLGLLDRVENLPINNLELCAAQA